MQLHGLIIFLQLKIRIFVTSLFRGEQLLAFVVGSLCACQRQDKQCLRHFYSHKTLGYPKMLVLTFCVTVKKLFLWLSEISGILLNPDYGIVAFSCQWPAWECDSTVPATCATFFWTSPICKLSMLPWYLGKTLQEFFGPFPEAIGYKDVLSKLLTSVLSVANFCCLILLFLLFM